MSHDHAHSIPTDYEGDFEFSNGKFAMWLFLVSDAMAFIGFLGAYMVLRMSATASLAPTPEDLTLPWRPAWGPHLDLILTGLNTFVLIISSVTMVKALAAFQDGFMNRGRMFLLATIAGGSFFVGFQVWEWHHLITEKVTMSGLGVPTLETAVKRAETNHSNVTRLGLAQELFGGRDTTAWDDEKRQNFTEEEYVNLPLEVFDAERGDLRPRYPGVVHLASCSIPAFTTSEKKEDGSFRVSAPKNRDDLRSAREAGVDEEGGRAKVLAAQREEGMRVANLFSSTFYVLTGFHGLHVLIGVLYLWVVYFRAKRGLYTPNNTNEVEIVGLYWHFVDLVWVLLFMFIYLI